MQAASIAHRFDHRTVILSSRRGTLFHRWKDGGFEPHAEETEGVELRKATTSSITFIPSCL